MFPLPVTNDVKGKIIMLCRLDFCLILSSFNVFLCIAISLIRVDYPSLLMSQ